MEITIDGKNIEINSDDKNIVDVADRAKIGIPAPCYRINRKKGCCQACVIEINGEKKYACTTKPTDGMNIIVDRDDLKKIRKEKIIKYKENQKNNTSCTCDCDCSGTTNNCC